MSRAHERYHGWLNLGAIALVAAAAVLLLLEAWSDSLTADESFYIRAGACALITGIGDLEPTNPLGFKMVAGASVVLLGSGSRTCGRTVSYASSDVALFYQQGVSSLHWLIFIARLPVILMTLLVAAIVFLWARAMFGVVAGVVATAVIALEPTVLAHGHLVTQDLPVTLGITGALATYWRWTISGGRRWLLVAGGALGLGMVSKVSALEVLPLLAMIGLIVQAGNPWRRVLRVMTSVGTVFLSAWSIVCLTYLPFRYLEGPHWPVPLSWLLAPAWLHEVRFQMQHVASGHPTYLNGQAYAAHGPWYYFLETIGLKTTIGLLLLTFAAVVMLAWQRSRNELCFLWLPIGLLVVIPSSAGLDLGIRYLLPIYPLLAVAAGSLVKPGLPFKRLRVVGASLFLLVSAGSSLGHVPLHLGYFNELAGQQPERFLSDSNLDWGQDLWRLRDWWTEHGKPPLFAACFSLLPLSDYGIDAQNAQPSRKPVVGLLAASLTRITISGDAFPAVAVAPYYGLERRLPIQRVGSSIFIFRMNGELASRIQLQRSRTVAAVAPASH